MNENELLVLKGRYILAQGNSGFAGSRPGFINGFENRPCEKVYQREFLFSDEMELFFFMGVIDFRPKGHISFDQRFSADDLSSAYFTPRALPWARIFWPFRPLKKSVRK